ncbi:hypothetical protein GQ602_001955 [Ophiocordyceps camponoti-floridani]|uniref:Uncharacterized protein n=1 Tax=Ophiocordyceps camponoti-floridani TaxID=2030778 RepID=A0A8H4VEX4_9HYPO|nr:hypothetical protein GQ602_001955 [Ophiocordyceps camponoti-floridani]
MAQQSSSPSTPVKVPSSAANYSVATLDPDLRSQINMLLLKEGHIARIHEALLHALNSDPSNWPTAIQSHALSLMRSGEASAYPALLRRVLDDIRASVRPPPSSSTTTTTTTTTMTAAAAGPNGESKAVATTNGLSPAATPCLAIPLSVIEEALRVTRECLDDICEIDDSESLS